MCECECGVYCYWYGGLLTERMTMATKWKKRNSTKAIRTVMKIKCLFFSDSEEKIEDLILYELDTVPTTQFNWQTKTHFTQNTKKREEKIGRKIERNQNKSKTNLCHCSNDFTYTPHTTHHTSGTMPFRCWTEDKAKSCIRLIVFGSNIRQRGRKSKIHSKHVSFHPKRCSQIRTKWEKTNQLSLTHTRTHQNNWRQSNRFRYSLIPISHSAFLPIIIYRCCVALPSKCFVMFFLFVKR